jgi:hypothetical protein
MSEYWTFAGKTKFYPFAMKHWEARLNYRYWPDEPRWLRLWFALRAIIARWR